MDGRQVVGLLDDEPAAGGEPAGGPCDHLVSVGEVAEQVAGVDEVEGARRVVLMRDVGFLDLQIGGAAGVEVAGVEVDGDHASARTACGEPVGDGAGACTRLQAVPDVCTGRPSRMLVVNKSTLR
ncbi:hypothetical protein BFF78_41400 [Streptomyces fodineus]|uniref:Uncharacterized protein n=1 Tax=Streptomyces fodineus TaxID=1904616 RepID=A0A1D7YM79_9ACTN|nr:hypothetical protein BFF78_41400 [Streptomyces fodineus]